VRLKFEEGRVVESGAEKGEEYLNAMLDADEGSRYLGELGIGTNYGIPRATKNILFDEKLGGTVHLAVGRSYEKTGGKNESSVHWDLISDLREGGELYADGQLLQKDGDILDEIGANYEHVRSEPEDSYPQTAYFYVSIDVVGDVDNLLSKLSEKHGFDVEIF
jgi:leucyl aminopeptidase (aminopeptidase T)